MKTIVGAVVLIVVIAVAGIAGFLLASSPSTEPGQTTGTSTQNTSPLTKEPPPTHDYFLLTCQELKDRVNSNIDDIYVYSANNARRSDMRMLAYLGIMQVKGCK